MRVFNKLLFSILILTVPLASGCKNYIGGRTEIDKIDFVRAIGVDEPNSKEGHVRLTVTTKISQPSSPKGAGGPNLASNMSSEGQTIFEADRNFSTFADKRLFWGQSAFIVFGENAAKKHTLKYLDWFARDHELRLNSRVVIVRNVTAEKTLDTTTTPQYFFADRLANIFDNVGSKSVSGEMRLADLIQTFDSEFTDAYIPYIKLVSRVERKKEDKDIQDIQLNGYAVFKGTNMIGYLDQKQSRGLNWIKNKVQTGVIVVKNRKGDKVSLEIIDTDGEIVPKWKGKKPTVTINVKLSCNVDEIESEEDVLNSEDALLLEKQINGFVKSEVGSTISYAQKHQADFIGIGDAIFHKYPAKFDSIKKGWHKQFADLKIDVNISSKISGTYNIKQPTRNKGGGK